MNGTTRRTAALAILILAAALSAAGCGASSSSTTTTTHTAAPAAATSAPAAATTPAPTPTPTPSEVACTSHSCIIQDAKSLIGGVAKDESVMTAMSCQSSTVKHLDPGIWSVHCNATSSDGSVWAGIATVLLTSSQVTWQPLYQVS